MTDPGAGAIPPPGGLDAMYTPLQLLPQWIPTEPLLIVLLVFILAVLSFNRGDKKYVNLEAQDEPAVVAIGVGLIAAAAGWAVIMRLPMSMALKWTLVLTGLALVAIGLGARYSKSYDLEEVLD